MTSVSHLAGPTRISVELVARSWSTPIASLRQAPPRGAGAVGSTTVTTPGSLTSWRRRNQVVLPAGFEPTLDWHRALAYLMPVRTSMLDYLDGVL